MDVLILAGSRPQPNEPLYILTRGGYTALLDLAGQSMVQRLLDTLSASSQIERVIIAGLPPYANLSCDHPLTIVEDHSDLLSGLRTGIQALQQQNPAGERVLVLSSNTPVITPPALAWLVEQSLAIDTGLFCPVIERSVIERRFPGLKRSSIFLKDMQVCLADSMVVNLSLASGENPLWQRLLTSRRDPLRQVSLLGLDTMSMILLRQLTLGEASRAIGKRLGVPLQAVLCPFPELSLTIEKPHQFRLVEAELARLWVA